MSTNEVIDAIRNIDESISRVKLTEITLGKDGTAKFDFVNDRAVSDEVSVKVKNYIQSKLPSRFSSVVVTFSKLVADRELVSRKIIACIEENFKSIAYSVNGDEITVSSGENGMVSYTVYADDDVCEYFAKNGVLDNISSYLEDNFCNFFYGEIKSTGKSVSNAAVLKEKVNSADYETIKCRVLHVQDPVKLWGQNLDSEAIYIADSPLASGSVSFAGKITAINQKTTKTGKPFYVVEIDDTTGKISGKIFMTKEKEKKIDKLQVGTEILTNGELELFNGSLSYLIKDVSYCVFPSDFKPEERPSKKVPDDYYVVKPEPLIELSQEFLFEEKRDIPECLKGKSFVVVDIETTGVSYLSGDKITEIGAVKIENGKITEKFTTLINPKIPISREITELTGIDDEMVADKPTFNDVLPDFFKFCYGSCIVAHNIEFDYKFIKYMAKDSGYVFTNDGIDTLALSKEILPRLKNHKLNTVCGYFNIEFLHHRAMSDAHATAKLFLELIFIKKSLPI
ncbi:MAG: 3'-5' exoribonuclease [Clostridia bacterium]|nr:3'-5' exoribonuclease [Clostridia bacterium]